MDNELENKVSQEESVLDTQPDLQPEGAGTPAELTEADGSCTVGAEEAQVSEERQLCEEPQVGEEAQVSALRFPAYRNRSCHPTAPFLLSYNRSL